MTEEADNGTIRVQKAINGLQGVLGLCEKYSDFIQLKLDAQLRAGNGNQVLERKAKGSKINNNKPVDITKELKYFEGGKLFPYQVEGVTWLTTLFENSINGILADEMGLGKTVQVIALISHLIERGMTGQVLIVVPLATVPNWKTEFARFAPKIPVEIFHGSLSERRTQHASLTKRLPLEKRWILPVVITTYQVVLGEMKKLQSMRWEYVVVDEGHKIKNHHSQIACALRSLDSANRLLLTGTPLQNNITELWALFNFLMPELFEDQENFSSLLIAEDLKDNNTLIKRERDTNIISTIHKVLAPFMLRRTKKDVGLGISEKKEVFIYCPMSTIQREMYTQILEKNVAKLLCPSGKEETETFDIDAPRPKRFCRSKTTSYRELGNREFGNRFIHGFVDDGATKSESHDSASPNSKKADFICAVTMQNITFMLKKVVDHPYLIHFPLEPTSQTLLIDEDLFNKSGKMKILDTLLVKLKKRGHKVLIYSTLVMTLDLVEECVLMRGYNYRRLDGSSSLESRETSINEFNNNPNVFLFLISTRAGGLGLNLVSADTVIFYDRDWNPQVDLQAQDRCHRIGQTRPVVVYTLVAKNTIDEKILACGDTKRRLEKLVMTKKNFRKKMDLVELQELLKMNENSEEVHTEDIGMSEAEWARILDRSDMSKTTNNQK